MRVAMSQMGQIAGQGAGLGQTRKLRRKHRAVLRQKLALDKRNRLPELGHLAFANDWAGLGRREEIHSNADVLV